MGNIPDAYPSSFRIHVLTLPLSPLSEAGHRILRLGLWQGARNDGEAFVWLKLLSFG